MPTEPPKIAAPAADILEATSDAPTGRFPEIELDVAKAGDNNDPSAASMVEQLPLPSTALKEDYRSQVELNLKANRELRGSAFRLLGLMSFAYLVALLVILIGFFNAEKAPAIISHAWNWHVYVLVGIVLIVFAAIPLTLAMALVKMITEKPDDKWEVADIKTPNVELAKIFADFIKTLGRG
ncbi:hypothetical protein N789_14065 [Arenimonas oryziterrae DSM 21050 = YC6267]|uniref:Uncharacterized protein n=1 Tax=Arenimonas oryziterrae DSM 21050 = YC6267 TaxID=1121015 RepID=A0A091ATH0_9GAMM|nr:hypothetical protein N789_14065 [Arenimonas oryziterrae DSM 21050 = YC6267]